MLDWLAEQDFKGRGGGENAMPDDAGYHRMGLLRQTRFVPRGE